MSAKAVGWVYDYSPYNGAKFAVHLAIADSANDQFHYEFWMALPKLGRKTRLTRQAVQKAVHQMVEDGALELVWESNGGRGRPSRYRLLMPTTWPQYYEATADEGDPEKPPTRIAVRWETANSGAQTANRVAATANGVGSHRTQEEPNEPRRVVCTACGEDFDDLEVLYSHTEQFCAVLNGQT